LLRHEILVRSAGPVREPGPAAAPEFAGQGAAQASGTDRGNDGGRASGRRNRGRCAASPGNGREPGKMKRGIAWVCNRNARPQFRRRSSGLGGETFQPEHANNFIMDITWITG